jgi:hypothetical protein
MQGGNSINNANVSIAKAQIWQAETPPHGFATRSRRLSPANRVFMTFCWATGPWNTLTVAAPFRAACEKRPVVLGNVRDFGV